MTPLVLLPGMNCSSRLWAGCDLDGRLVTLDRPTLDEQVTQVLEVAPRGAVLIGLSLGAVVAMAATRRAPGRFAGLCLISSNAKAPTPVQRAGWQQQRDRLAAGATARDLQAELLPLLLGPAATTDPRLVETTLTMADDVGSDALAAQLAMQATRVDERPCLARLGVPTLVIGGRHDALCPPAFAEEIAGAVPGARLELIDAGHLAPLERPDLAGSLIRDWLDG